MLKSRVEPKKEMRTQTHRTSQKKKKRPEVETVIVDETHTPGEHPNRTDEFFGMAATRTHKPRKMADTSHRLRKKLTSNGEKTDELKYNKINRERPEEVDNTLKKITNTGAKTQGVFVIKGSDKRPEYWNDVRTYERHILVLAELLDEVFSKTKSNDLKIVIDRHDNYVKGNAKDIVKMVAKHHGKNVKVVIEDSKKGTHKDLLQAQDCISFSMGEYIITGNEDRIKITGMDLKEITKNGRVSKASKK